MERFAILSVYDKQGLEPFARGLVELGYTILSTGGTAAFLKSAGIPIRSISDYTGHPEILDGRVKSLHPKIHGGILARRDLPGDMEQLAANGIAPIDVVAVNLYPFLAKSAEVAERGAVPHESLVESIDIGGPTMIRAAAKNSQFVLPVCDPADYSAALELLAQSGAPSADSAAIDTAAIRQEMADKVFAMMSAYDGSISRYFSLNEQLLDSAGTPHALAPVETVVLRRQQELRYGENPHQHAGFYVQATGGTAPELHWQQLQGKELSYNNLLDMYATLDLFLELVEGTSKQVSVIIKHSNPCGAAVRGTAHEAFLAARECDPVSAFGGIVAVSGTLDAQTAAAITEGFVEIVLVPEVSAAAKEIFKKKKNLRLIEIDLAWYLKQRAAGGVSYRNYYGEWLVQTTDTSLSEPKLENLIAGRTVSPEALEDARFAWRLCKHVKSNAIVIVKNLQAVGVGAGQMSRVDSARIALQRAAFHEHDVTGSVAASDAFLPFPDTLEILAEGGVRTLVQPGGSIKDDDVVQAAERLKVAMFATGERHFRH